MAYGLYQPVADTKTPVMSALVYRYSGISTTTAATYETTIEMSSATLMIPDSVGEDPFTP
jgi:hypothetical protein